MATGKRTTGNKGPMVANQAQTASVTLGRIVVLTDMAGQDEGLLGKLENAGYRVELVKQPGSFHSICGGQSAPAAIILNRDLKADESAISSVLAAMQARCVNTVPVIFLSAQKDIAARLAAYRAGATHFLPKPLDHNRLLHLIAESELLKSATPCRVMLVGNVSRQQEEHAQLLRSSGMEICIVNDPLSVPDMLENFAADVMLLDMEMALCTGPELALILRDEPRYAAIPIIYLTTESELLLQIKTLNIHSENYLSKMVSPEPLLAVVREHARSYRHSLEQAAILSSARYELERQQQAIDYHAIVSVADVSGKIVFVNEKFCQISGYSSDELIGKNHRIIKSGQHPPEFYAEMWHTISGGNIWHGEVCNRSKNGNLYWVHTSIVPFVDAEGLPYQYISIRTDITRVKESEQRLNRSQSFANISTWDWNIQTGELVWSEGIAPLFGYAEGKLVHNYENFLNAIHPDDLQMVSDAIKDCVEAGISYNIEHRCVWPDGSIHWLLERGDVVRELNGKPLHMLGLVQDITPRKQAELGIIESNARLEEAQSLAKLGNWEADMVSGELYWSDEIYRIFGQDKKRFSPSVTAFKNAVHPDDLALVQASEQRAAATGIHDVVHRIIRPDGEVRYVHELARSQFDADGKLLRLRGTVQDVTELKRAEQAMLEAKEVAEAASRAKSEFLASMSHELRTPLNAILGFSQLFAMDEQLPQKTRENSRQIEYAGKHLLSLVNDLIDLARIESSKLELLLEAVKVKDVVCDSLNMVQSMANDKSIQIILMQCDVMEITVLADFNRLRQAVINLLSNAIKYNRQNGTVHMVCEVLEERAHIAVTDTGPGIPADKQERIFIAFDRLGEERGEIEGTGIGLVITKRIVEAMGGTIGFESTPGQGSTFWLTFPLSTNTARTRPGPSAVESSAVFHPVHARQTRPVVLYVEDNPMNLRLMQQVFAGRKEWELRSAVDAESGLEMARADPPQLILLDINLPGMDGYRALKLLRGYPETAGIPVVALTANAMKGERELGLSAGFAEYLTKPLDILKLLELLENLLD